MDEAMTGNFTWESDEAQGWESDEAIAESDESAEDIGERARRRRQPKGYGRFVPISGRKGVVVRGPGGTTVKTPFDTPLATAAEVNRGLAGQATANSELAKRLDRAERSFQAYRKNSSSATGLLSIGLIAGMGGIAAFRVAGPQTSPSGSRLKDYTNEDLAKGANVAAVAQLGLSTSQLIFTGQWPRGLVSNIANVFSAVHIAVFTFGFFSTPTPTPPIPAPTVPKLVKTKADAITAMNSDPVGTLYLTLDNSELYLVIEVSGAKQLFSVTPPTP